MDNKEKYVFMQFCLILMVKLFGVITKVKLFIKKIV